jgi:hypothetical protein
MTFQQEVRSWRVRDGALIVSIVLFGAMSVAVQLIYLKVPKQEQSPFVSSEQRMLLTKLTDSDKPIECAEGLIPIPDTVLDPTLAWTDGRKIPRVVHVNSKSRCMTKEFAENTDKWRLKDHSLFMHDDDAMDRLLNRYWPEFPQLQQIQKCTNFGGPLKADIWRALILYEYGGIYTDIGNAPDKFNDNTLQPEDDAFFVIDPRYIPGEWFMAISPRHPIMYMTVTSILQQQFKDERGGFDPVVWKTDWWKQSPGVINKGLQIFTRGRMPYPEPGLHKGTEDRSVRLVKETKDSYEYVSRNLIKDKLNLYEKMNMTDFLRMDARDQRSYQTTKLTCLEHMYRVEEESKGVHEKSPQW